VDHTLTDSPKTFAAMFGRRRDRVLWGFIAVTLVSAALLASGLLSEEAAFDFSSFVYVIVPVGAGVAVMAAALTLGGRERIAWFVIGTGGLLWGLGEVIWVLYEYVLVVEVPYPGLADALFLVAYPVVFVGILLLPHVKPRRLERFRLSLDALAGTVAVAAIMWVWYLRDQIYLDPEAGFLEQFVNIMYPLADVILLIAVLILTIRRSTRRFDMRLIALGASLLVGVIADIIFVLQVEADTYASGGWLDALWLVDYAFFALAAWFLLHPGSESEQADRSTRYWQMVAPYGAVALLFVLTLRSVGGEGSVLEIATAVVAILVIARQGVAIRENRELVERQRNDLIASISHELRTPMTSVTGFTAILDEEWESLDRAESAEMVSIVNQQAQHVNRIVTDLVGLARDTLEFHNLTLERCDVAALVANVETMLATELNGDITVDTHLEPNLWVKADPQRFTQVLVNLLTNAARYGDGNIRVDAFNSNGTAILEIHDNGPGIPKRYEETIWERFERGPHRYDATIPGSGVGLPIARALIESHHGTITQHRSTHLGGACFVVSLPTTSPPAQTPKQHATAAAA
jgi:signal transduction histidine kinase